MVQSSLSETGWDWKVRAPCGALAQVAIRLRLETFASVGLIGRSAQ